MIKSHFLTFLIVLIPIGYVVLLYLNILLPIIIVSALTLIVLMYISFYQYFESKRYD